jgi:hypothetical protein
VIGSTGGTEGMDSTAIASPGANGEVDSSDVPRKIVRSGAKRPTGSLRPDHRPMDAAEPAAARGRSAEAKSASTLRPPPAWKSPVKLEIPTGSWKTLRVYHIAHRLYDEEFISRKRTNERPHHRDHPRSATGTGRPMDVAGPCGPRKTMMPSSAPPTGRWDAAVLSPLGPATRSATM